MSRWIHWSAFVLLLISLVASVRQAPWAARCRSGMVEQELPDESTWRKWRLLPDLSGYEVVDLTPYRDPGCTSPRPHPMGDARLAGHGVCAERGVSVQSWLGQDFVAMTGDDWTLRLREDPASHTILVTGERTRPSEEQLEPRPIVAFQVEADGASLLAVRVAAWPLASVLGLVFWWRRRLGRKAAASGERA